MIDGNEVSFFRRHFGVTKEDVIKAVAVVGNCPKQIELYLLQQGIITYNSLREKHRP